MKMKIVEISQVNDCLAEMVALFRVELRSYKGIESKPNLDAGREEMDEYLSAGFPVFAAMEDGKYAGYVVCRVDSEVVWVESIFVKEEYRRHGVATMLHSKAEEIAASYFKNKPSVAFTCVSALVIVLSFLANAAIYLRESAFLKYWDIDVLYASVSSPNQLYRVCGNVVFAICVMLAITIINGAYEAYIPTRRLIISFTEIVNSNKKEVEKVSKDGKRAISRARKFRRKHPEKRVKGQAQKMREVEKSNKETLSKALALYEEAKKIARSLSKEIIVHFVVAGIIVTVGYSLFALLDSDRSVNFWVHVIADCVTLSILFLGCLITHRKEINKREIRQNAYDSIPQHVEDLLKDDHEYPLKKKWSTYFSDSAFIAMLVSAVVYTVFFLFAFNSLGHTAAISKNDFSIINYEDTT